MIGNNAREEIFEMIGNAESNSGVPNDMLRKIYELEESAVHLRNRQVKKKIQEVISDAIKIADNTESQSMATKPTIS